MNPLLRVLPARSPDHCFRATGHVAEQPAEVELDATSIRVGSTALELDERLRATLGWSHPDRNFLVLELASVESAFERTELCLVTAKSG